MMGIDRSDGLTAAASGGFLLLLVMTTSQAGKPAADVIANNMHCKVLEDAPRGTLVATVYPQQILSTTRKRNIRLRVVGPDRRSFRMSGDDVIVADDVLKRPAGSNYTISVQAKDTSNRNALQALWRIDILVVKRNVYAPHFSQDTFTAEVYRKAEIGTRVIQVSSQDRDPEEYNAVVTYSLRTGPQGRFAVEPDSGWIKTAVLLGDAKPVLYLQVTATDNGYPAMSMAVGVTIIVRDIGAPTNFTVTTTMTTCTACWQHPREGRVLKYMVTYARADDPNELNSHTVKAGKEALTCIKFTDLEPLAEYWAEVRAQNEGKSGVPSRIWFYTREDACSGNPCGGGRCLLTEQHPGFRCVCQEPVTCANNSCTNATCYGPGVLKEIMHVIKSCRNGGTFHNDTGTGRCECPKGFAGSSCQFRDLCARDHEVCQHGALCETISSTRFKCKCHGGYYGDTCEHFNPCSLDPCRNGATCKNLTVSSYKCGCTHGYYGKNCTRYNPCASFPCQNNAVCRNVSEEYYLCDCLTGYHGHECENYNPCLHDPCLHGGMCNSIDGRYVCECAYGRYGKHCEHMNLCEALLPCGENSLGCRNTSDTHYRCICKSGWSGQNCTTYDPCFDKPCLHDNLCVVTSERDYSCACTEPYFGRHCEKTNPCAQAPCKNSGSCMNTSDTGFLCKCPEGYYGVKCENYNPCIKGICMNSAICVNTSDTTYHCSCPPEFFGDLCQYYNSCYVEPCKHGRCITKETGKHECQCDPGYTGRECQFYDPCGSNPCQNGATCTNTTELADLCQCIPGYFGSFCEHFEACRSSPCRSGTCLDRPNGRFHCICPKGLFGPTCESSDPCAGQPCSNQGTCISMTGPSFRCICPTGFYGDRCKNYNPCVSNPCHNAGTCRHTSNDQFTCDCWEGFQGPVCDIEIPCDNQRPCLHDGTCIKRTSGDHIQIYCQCRQGYSGKKCELYDPCSTNPCLNQGNCIRRMDPVGVLHRFECQCQNGFFGERCEYHTPCLSFPCKNNGTCVRTAAQDVCKCPEGFTGEICERDVNECRVHKCQNGGTCRNLPGTFRCICTPGYKGRDCEIPDSCPREVLYEPSGTFQWSSIAHGIEVTHPCPRNPQHLAFRRCFLGDDGFLHWSEPDTSACATEVTSADMAMQALAPFRDGNVTWMNADELLIATELMEQILPIAMENTRVAADVFAVIDQIILSAPSDVMEGNITARILNIMDDLQAGMTLDGSTFDLELSSLELMMKLVTNDERHSGLTFKSRITTDKGDTPIITVPSEVFRIYSSAQRAQFAYFKNSKLFKGIDNGNHHSTNHVISAGLGHHKIMGLHKCISYMLPNPQEAQRKCVYWNENDRRWSASGMRTVSWTGGTVQCCSDHLTHFAVLDHVISGEVTSSHESLVFLISFCGTGVSILCLFVVLLTYSLFRILNRESFGQVVIQLCLSMLLSNVCILVGFHKKEVDDDVICLVVASLSHYFTLSTLLWLSVTSQHVYKTLGSECVIKDRCFILKRSVIAWGLPAAVIAVPLGLDMDVYKADTKRCLISPHHRLLYCGTYLTPACLVLFTNATLFVLVLKTSLRPRYEMKNCAFGMAQARGTCVLLAFVGISWIIGYLAERDQSVNVVEPFMFEYAYFGSLTLCGMLTLLFYGVLRSDACAAWRNLCCKRCTAKRRRVGGKNTMGATRMSSEGSDYTLVADPKYSRRAAEEEKMLDPCTSIESLSTRGAHRGGAHAGSSRSGHYGHSSGHRSEGPGRCRTPDSNVSLLQRQYLAVESDSLPASPSPHSRRGPQAGASSRSGHGGGAEWMQHSKI